MCSAPAAAVLVALYSRFLTLLVHFFVELSSGDAFCLAIIGCCGVCGFYFLFFFFWGGGGGRAGKYFTQIHSLYITNKYIL